MHNKCKRPYAAIVYADRTLLKAAHAVRHQVKAFLYQGRAFLLVRAGNAWHLYQEEDNGTVPLPAQADTPKILAQIAMALVPPTQYAN